MIFFSFLTKAVVAFYDIPYRLLQFPVFLLCVATTTTTAADEIAKITFQSFFFPFSSRYDGFNKNAL